MHVYTIIESREATFFENIYPYNIQSEPNSLKKLVIVKRLWIENIQMRKNIDVVSGLGWQPLLGKIF